MEPITQHQLRAAAHVALLVDVNGNEVLDLATAYRLAETSGIHSPSDLAAAQQLLLRAGVLAEIEERIHPTALLHQLLALGDLDLATRVLTGRVFTVDELEARRAFGALGEEAVAEHARAELIALGYPNLARNVSRVSLLDDTLGYDITAPNIDGTARLLEVKSGSRHNNATTRFYLSRNEYRVGADRREAWAMVACHLNLDDGGGSPKFSWCRASTIAPYLPQDAGGRWEQALVEMPGHLLNPGLPPPL